MGSSGSRAYARNPYSQYRPTSDRITWRDLPTASRVLVVLVILLAVGAGAAVLWLVNSKVQEQQQKKALVAVNAYIISAAMICCLIGIGAATTIAAIRDPRRHRFVYMTLIISASGGISYAIARFNEK